MRESIFRSEFAAGAHPPHLPGWFHFHSTSSSGIVP